MEHPRPDVLVAPDGGGQVRVWVCQGRPRAFGSAWGPVALVWGLRGWGGVRVWWGSMAGGQVAAGSYGVRHQDDENAIVVP